MKRKFKQYWSTITPISTKQTTISQLKCCKQYWSTITPISTKQTTICQLKCCKQYWSTITPKQLSLNSNIEHKTDKDICQCKSRACLVINIILTTKTQIIIHLAQPGTLFVY